MCFPGNFCLGWISLAVAKKSGSLTTLHTDQDGLQWSDVCKLHLFFPSSKWLKGVDVNNQKNGKK